MGKQISRLKPADVEAFDAWLRKLVTWSGTKAQARRNLGVAKATLDRMLLGNITPAIAAAIQEKFDRQRWPADCPTPPWRSAPAGSPPRPVDEVMALVKYANALSTPRPSTCWSACSGSGPATRA